MYSVRLAIWCDKLWTHSLAPCGTSDLGRQAVTDCILSPLLGTVLAVSKCRENAECDCKNAVVPSLDVPTVVDVFCLHVKLSSHWSLFAASPNLATSQPGHRVFACLLIAPECLKSECRWKWWARGCRFPHEDFSQFHPLLPPEKAKFLFCLAWSLFQVASF